MTKLVDTPDKNKILKKLEEKGDHFEKFIEDKFGPHYFTIVDKTHPFNTIPVR